MTSIKAIECNNIFYYLENDLKEIDKAYFYGCSKSRSMIEKKSIPETEYLFAVLSKKMGSWDIKNREYKPSKLLISKTWADYNVPALRPPLPLTDKVENPFANDIRMAPPILELEDHEKFRDVDGNVLEIEVRGERHHKKCFFLMKDVSKVFNIIRLYETLTNNGSTYNQKLHYQYFIRSDPNPIGVQSNEKLMYLTYNGIMKVLFSSKTGRAELFQEWATERLFTIQMGAEEDRDALAGEILGVSPKTIHEVFRKNTEKTPCIYLFQVSSAKQMFPDEENPNDDIICKFGFTDDLPRRTREHTTFFQEQRKLGKVSLLCFSIIDPKFLSDAETRLSRMFRHYKVSYEDQKELIRMSKQELKEIRADFGLIQKSFLGCYTELVNKIHELELLLEKEKSRSDLLEKELIIKQGLIDNESLKRQLLELRLQHYQEQK